MNGNKLLTEHNLDNLEFLSLQGGCTGSSEPTLVKIPNMSRLVYIICRGNEKMSVCIESS